MPRVKVPQINACHISCVMYDSRILDEEGKERVSNLSFRLQMLLFFPKHSQVGPKAGESENIFSNSSHFFAQLEISCKRHRERSKQSRQHSPVLRFYF